MARTRQWPPLGLCCKIEGKEDESVELLKCEAVADIADDDAGVRLTQYFSNPSFGTDKEDQEAVYKFPLIGDVAVYYFKSCYLSEQGEPLKTLFGKAKEKQQAREEYEQAKANGKAAQLLEIDYENSPDLFVMSLGNIPSNCKTVSVELAFYCPLQTEEKGVVKRFTLPSVLTGRYGKFSPSAFTGPNVKNAAALFSFEANICLGNFVSSLESPTHTISSKLMIGGSPSRAQVTFSKAEEPLSKDLVLKISSGTAPKSSLLVQTPESIPNPEFAKDFPDTTLAKLTLNCALEVPEEAEIKKNFIFVVDRSGSMSGASMRNCKKALQLCLASLPEECQFDICSFGSNFDFLFNGTSRDYSEATLNAARDHVEAMTANYGGTEILQPLQKIVEAKSDIPTVVFLLTDGQVYNTSSIVSLIKKEHEKSGTTVFTCGIGSGVDHSLVDGLAKAGGGTATYISYGEKMNAKLAAQMEQAIEPPCTNLKLEFGELRMSPAKLGWNPVSVLPAFVYSGQRIDCYMTLDSTSLLALRKILETEDEVPPIQLLGKITVEGKAETVSIAQVDLRKDMLETDSNLVVPAFRQQIALVEEALKTKKSEKKKAIAFAVAANIVTKYTSLVAVEEGNEGEERQAELEKPRPKSLYRHNYADKQSDYYSSPQVHAMSFGIGLPSLPSLPSVSLPSLSNPFKRMRKSKKKYASSKMLTGPPMKTFKEGSEDVINLNLDSMLNLLISFQKTDGSFIFSDDFSKLMDVKDINNLERSAAMATALAIQFMEIKLRALESEWKLMKRKALRWLQKNVPNSEEILDVAKKCLSHEN